MSSEDEGTTDQTSANAVPHDLHEFMQQTSDEIAAEYRRVVARAREDPGTAGDQGEENWAGLLRAWLPDAYHVVTKGRILAESGQASPQVDVLVLAPSYPRKLRDKKTYLAAGVAAAFECKLTLRAGHIGEAVRNASHIRRILRSREGSPYRELNSPLVFGLLAHAHDWMAPASTPIENVERALWQADLQEIAHPREMLDLVCVANLATWTSAKTTFVGPALVQPWTEAFVDLYGEKGSATCAYIGPDGSRPTPATPIGVMFAWLLMHLAWEDPGLRPLADYWRLAGMFGSGAGKMRAWDVRSVYTDPVAVRVLQGGLTNGVPWDEWSVAFI